MYPVRHGILTPTASLSPRHRRPKQVARLIGDVIKTHKGQVEAGDVTRIAEELLKG
jgi:hypothetical protein